MAKTKKQKPGQGLLLDAWIPPSSAGAPVGCLATSYTFDSVFFEEQCLARFAGIRTGATDEAHLHAYLVEREERLSQIKTVVLVDKDHCRGPRSPRWDLLCARGGTKGGILHAKMSLLIWAKHVRLVIASANITPSGYRRNRELYTVLDAAVDLPLARQAIVDALDYLQNLTDLSAEKNHPAINRWVDLLNQARDRIVQLAEVCPEAKNQVFFLGTGPGTKDFFTQLERMWSSNNLGTPRQLYAISPFYDADESAVQAVWKRLWGLGAERGEVALALSAPSMGTTEGNGKVQVLAPLIFGTTPRGSCTVSILGVSEYGTDENGEVRERRSLHAKALSIEGDRWCLIYAGSANLTKAGTGLASKPNWEAGLAMTVDMERDDKGYALHCDAWNAVAGEEIENYVLGELAMDSEELVRGGERPLPDGFKWALYRKDGDGSLLEIEMGSRLPKSWDLFYPNADRFTGSEEWIKGLRPSTWIVPWPLSAAPSGLEVYWEEDGVKLNAWLPICAADTSDLPPPDELRRLPLEILIEVLTSTRPVAQVIADYLSRRKTDTRGSGPILDPLARQDSSGYLIPRTRRISQALNALRERLEEPCATRESLEWRLRGPFGALAVREAIFREARSEDEKAFFTTEMCQELADVEPHDLEGGLKASEIKKVIHLFISEQADLVENSLEQVGKALGDYARDTIGKLKEVR